MKIKKKLGRQGRLYKGPLSNIRRSHISRKTRQLVIVPNPSNRTNRHDIYCFERDDNDYMETGLNGAVKQTLMLFNLNVLFRVRRSS